MAAKARLELELFLKNKLGEGFTKAKQFVGSKMSDLKDQVNSFHSSNVKAFTAIKDEVPGAARVLGLLTNPYALAAVAALAFGAAAIKATNMALDWERSMAEINVTAQLAKPELSKLSDQILAIGARGSTELEDVPKAFNRIISAGLDVNTSLKALEPTLKAAKAGFTDVETVAAAGIGVMTSSGEEINRVYDILFATLNKGNVKFQEIAQYLPKIIPGAKNAGFSLAEVGGAFAFLTAKGQTAEATTTGLLNVFKSLSRPEIIYGTKDKLGLKGLGVDVFDATGKMKPFITIIEDLNVALSKTKNKEEFVKAFSQIGLDQDAVAAVATMVQNVGDLKSTIDFTTDSTGQLNKAVENSRTSTEGWKEGMNKFKVLMIQFGQNFLPLVSAIGEGFSWVMEQIIGGVQVVKEFYNQSVLLQDIFSVLGFTVALPFKILGTLFGWIVDLVKWIDSKLGVSSVIAQFFRDMETLWIGLKAVASGVMSLFTELWKVIAPLGDALANLTNPVKLAQSLAQAKEAFTNANFKDAFNVGFRESIKESLITKTKVTEVLNTEELKPKANDVSGAVGDGSSATGESSPHVGGASAQKVINITIDSLHKGDNVIRQDGSTEGMSLDELERKMNEIFLRMLRNANAAF